jgi:signal peptide peptidase SppA
VDANGVARIPIYGVIAKRASMVNGISQNLGTSIEEVRRDFNAAISDTAVKTIVLDVDSPGGSVDGVAEMSDMIFNARGKKPIVAYADGMMASAAYWLASAADKIYASKSSEVGSIGVYAVVSDYSVANHVAGIKTEVIKAGKHKAAGHPDKPMTEEDKAVIQEDVNDYYDLFTNAISRNRGMTMEEVLKVATGKTFIGQKALDVGLVDGIDHIESALGSLQSGNNGKQIKSSSIEAKKTKCLNCENEFWFGAEPETAMGAVKCPKCGVIVDQTGVVLDGRKNKEEDSDMEMKSLTLEAIRAERPDLAEALIEETKIANATAVEAAVKAETVRILGINDKTKSYLDVEGINDLVKASIEKGESIEIAEKGFMAKKLEVMEKGSNKGPGADQDVEAAPKTHLEKAKAYATANKCSMVVALKATAPARVKA